jgi:hypothetical protein
LRPFRKCREEGVPTEHEESARQQILDGLIADKAGDKQISTVTRILGQFERILNLNITVRLKKFQELLNCKTGLFYY